MLGRQRKLTNPALLAARERALRAKPLARPTLVVSSAEGAWPPACMTDEAVERAEIGLARLIESGEIA